VVVEELNYVPSFGGTAEFVLRPTDESKFMSEFDERMFLFFHCLPSPGRRPVLVTIVDSSGREPHDPGVCTSQRRRNAAIWP
jgi:hypothetical protein